MESQIKQPINIALLFLILIFYIGCSDTHPYPAETLSKFNASCVSSSGDKRMCACILKTIQETYSYEDFVTIEKTIETGGDTTEFMTFIEEAKQACAE